MMNKYNKYDGSGDLDSRNILMDLCYLIRQKCTDGNDSSHSGKWDDLIQTLVCGKPRLQLKLVQKLAENGNIQAACSYAKRYYIPPDELPQEVLSELKDYDRKFYSNRDIEILKFSDTTKYAEETEDWGAEVSTDSSVDSFSTLTDSFYQLPVPSERIQLIDRVEDLKNLTKELYSNAEIIGFDCEWNPVKKVGEQDRISIMQLAVPNHAYIIDLFKLYVIPNSEDVLKDFFTLFFTSKHIIKVGYGIINDLKMLIGMFGYMTDLINKSIKLVDLGEVTPTIINHPLVIPYLHPIENTSVLKEKGLSLLVNQTLGLRLNKSEQVSDWERRPLNHVQLQYAASDAYCLLEVYSFLDDILKKTNINGCLTANLKLKWLEKQIRKEHLSQNKPLYKGPPRPTSSFKVVCDHMLEDFGKSLRACGVDTIVMDSKKNHSRLINLFTSQDRIILTGDKPFFVYLKGYVPNERCMWIPGGKIKEQLRMVFTRYNIAVQSKNIVRRCTECNSDEYRAVKSEEMQLLYELKNGGRKMISEQTTLSGLINLSNYTLQNGVEIQLDFVPRNIDLFYICNQCGKIHWEGCCIEQVKYNFQHLIDKREMDRTFYGVPG